MNEHGHEPPKFKTRAEVEAHFHAQKAAQPTPSAMVPTSGARHRFKLERELHFFAGDLVDVEIVGRCDVAIVCEARHCADGETLAKREAYGHAPPRPPVTFTVALGDLADHEAIASHLSAALGVMVMAT